MNARDARFVFIPLFLAVALVGCSKNEPAAPSTPSQVSPPTTSAPSTGPAATVGQKIDDATITAKVKTALIADPDVKATDINVDTSGGIVTLKGTVGTQTQIDKAVQIAKGTEGVTSVQNQLAAK